MQGYPARQSAAVRRRRRGNKATPLHKATPRPRKPRGVVLFRGPSPFNGAPVVVIALFASGNRKTGNMIQTYVLLDDGRSPTDAVHSGADRAICGDCPMRGLAGFKGRRCYVNVGQGPLIVWGAHKPEYSRGEDAGTVALDFAAGAYPDYVPAEHDRYFRGRAIRWGTYGEPVLIPIDMVARLSALADSWTGYTHQWQRPEFDAYRFFFMASVHTPAEGAEANRRGWRYFRTSHNATARDGECVCPASEEAGRRATCEDCTLCKGRGGAPDGARLPRNVVIGGHGGTAVMAALRILG